MKVLFICTANSCRSQMAEAWARSLFPPSWHAASAGLLTCDIGRRTRAAMAEVGLDMEGQKSKSIDAVDLNEFDLVVTLSDDSARYLPELLHPERHWPRPVADPMAFAGAAADRQDDFRRGRDEIRGVVVEIIAKLL